MISQLLTYSQLLVEANDIRSISLLVLQGTWVLGQHWVLVYGTPNNLFGNWKIFWQYLTSFELVILGQVLTLKVFLVHSR